jgi:UDP-glucose 4-epimerase
MINKMKRYLVVGGAGFIGSNLVAELVKSEDCSLVVADDLSLGRLDSIRPHMGAGRASFEDCDCSRADLVDSVFSRRGPFDAVFHLAANSDIERSSGNPAIEYERTFMTTYRVLEAMRAHGVGEMVFCSSSAIYGDKDGVAVDETEGPYLPISYYGGAKLACEGFISAYAHMNGMRAVILRFPNVVGDNATHGVILDFIRRLKADSGELRVLGDGNQEKPFLYVKDLVDAILFVRRSAPEPVAVYNVGVDSRTKVRDIARIVVEEMGLKDVKLSYAGGSKGWKGDVPKFGYDLSKIHALGWKAAKSSDEAVRLAARTILKEMA